MTANVSKYKIIITRTAPHTLGDRTIKPGWIARWHAPVAENSPLYVSTAAWSETRKNAYSKARRFARTWKRGVDRDVAAGVAAIEAEQRS